LRLSSRQADFDERQSVPSKLGRRFGVSSLCGKVLLFAIIPVRRFFRRPFSFKVEMTPPASDDQGSCDDMRMKIGLVLAGGGAKGAYQIGVWKALTERGVRVSAFAGTSIGALNAAILASDRNPENACQAWRALSTQRIARFSLLCLPAVMLNLLAHFSDPSYKTKSFRRRRMYIQLSIIGTIFALAAIATKHVKDGISTGLLIALWAIPVFGSALAHGLNLGLLARETLSELVDRLINWQRMKTCHFPVFVTIARESPGLHLDDRETAAELRASPVGRSEGMDRQIERCEWNAMGNMSLVPEYVDITRTDIEHAKNCIIASMALPFGLFRRVRIGRNEYFDGGLADNTPVYPLLQAGLDKIYVVHCNSAANKSVRRLLTPSQLEREQFFVHYRRYKAGYERHPLPDYEREYKAPFLQMLLNIRLYRNYDERDKKLFETCEDDPPLPFEVVHITPSQRLGYPLLGIIWFSRRKTERLLDLGYRDGLAVLDSLDRE
jgi:predicted acylesterase/phospholipase RssA